jgi:hypothetical protein
MADFTNFDQVVAYLKRFADGFDFTRVGVDQSLGRDLKNVVVARIAERCAKSVGPDGQPWEKNSTTSSPWMPYGYKGWKDEEYEWPDNPNYRTGQMLSALSLGAASRITAREVIVAYGTGLPPKRSVSPNNHFDPETDGVVTDLEKAEWAHDGGAHGVKRPFYALGDGDAAALVELCQHNLNEYILTSPYGVA